VAGGWWLVAGGWWLVAGGWWLVVGGWWLVAGGQWLVVLIGYCVAGYRTTLKLRNVTVSVVVAAIWPWNTRTMGNDSES